MPGSTAHASVYIHTRYSPASSYPGFLERASLLMFFREYEIFSPSSIVSGYHDVDVFESSHHKCVVLHNPPNILVSV